MEARDIQMEFVGPIGKDDGKRYKTQTLTDLLLLVQFKVNTMVAQVQLESELWTY